MSDERTELSKRMRQYTGPEANELVELADKFDAATKGFFSEPQTHTVQQFLGSYAKAKRRWSELSGEPLI